MQWNLDCRQPALVIFVVLEERKMIRRKRDKGQTIHDVPIPQLLIDRHRGYRSTLDFG